MSTTPVNLSLVDGLYWGVIVATVLFGITIVQAWIYANNNTDGWFLRFLVTVLVLGDLTTTCLDTVIIHQYLVAHFTRFRDLENLIFLTPAFAAEFFVTNLVVLLVQLIFASRVYTFRKGDWLLSCAIALFATGGFVAGIYTGLTVAQVGFGSQQIRISIGLSEAMIVMADVITTTSLYRSLSSAHTRIRILEKRRPDIEVVGTRTVLQSLLIYVVSRGLLVAVVTFSFLVEFLLNAGSLSWAPLHLSMSKLYVITLVAILNERVSLRARRTGMTTERTMSMSTSSNLSGRFNVQSRKIDTATSLKSPERALQSHRMTFDHASAYQC